MGTDAGDLADSGRHRETAFRELRDQGTILTASQAGHRTGEAKRPLRRRLEWNVWIAETVWRGRAARVRQAPYPESAMPQ